MRNTKILTVLITLGVLGSSAAYLVFSPSIENYRNRTEFNSETWKNWKETETTACLRWDMTHSLATQHELVGMSTEEIIELLGTPSRQSNSNLSYYLGMTRHGIDTGALNLNLKDGIVVSYEIWHG